MGAPSVCVMCGWGAGGAGVSERVQGGRTEQDWEEDADNRAESSRGGQWFRILRRRRTNREIDAIPTIHDRMMPCSSTYSGHYRGTSRSSGSCLPDGAVASG